MGGSGGHANRYGRQPLEAVEGFGRRGFGGVKAAAAGLPQETSLPHHRLEVASTMKELIKFIAQALVDQPDQVVVAKEVEGERDVGHRSCKVAKEDLGKVIGKQGRTARAMRTISSHRGLHQDSQALGP